jgi:uncharacterized protein RhaS with RHS repeats
MGWQTYDFGTRFYDPVIGRWMTIDPLAEKYPYWSPYTYVKNNPINSVDIDGKEDFLLKQIKDSRETNAESAWLVYPTGTFNGVDVNTLRDMSVNDIKEQFGSPLFERMGSSLPDNPSKSDNDKGGNATIAEGKYKYEKGTFTSNNGQPGLNVLYLNQGKEKGVVNTENTNYKNNPEGEKKALGVAAHAGKVDWQNQVTSGQNGTVAKGSEGCPVTTGFNQIYNKVENKGNFIIVRDQKKYEDTNKK